MKNQTLTSKLYKEITVGVMTDLVFVDKEDPYDVYSWNRMVGDFTTETTAGELTDEEIAEMDDQEFVDAVEKFTNFRLAVVDERDSDRR